MLYYFTVLLMMVVVPPQTHDITSLGPWGPYSKIYSGTSHITDVRSGVSVDFTLVPGFYRRTANVPNELFENENGCYPWKFSPELNSWTYRHEIEWKDRVYVDATYHVVDDHRVLLEMHCVNNTEMVQDLLLHDMVSIRHAEEYPAVRTDAPIIKGTAYSSYEPAVIKHNYSLVYDGWLRGEKRDPASLTGSVLETAGDAGDAVVYDLPEGCPGTVTMRLKAGEDETIAVSVNGKEMVVKGTGKYELVNVETGGKGTLELKTLGKGRLTVDALLILENAAVEPAPLRFKPELTEGDGWLTVKYEDDPMWYGIAWNYPLSEVNQYINGELDVFLRRMVHRHNQNVFEGDGRGHFTSVFHRPVTVAPMSDTTLFNLLVCGDKALVDREVSAFGNSEAALTASVERVAGEEPRLLPGAEKYAFGHQIIQANLLNNIVYPVWTQDSYIRHFTPGKNWNSLYTWDSGFIAWAMSEVSPQKAFEIVRAYTADEGSQSAFIHHGTPLPIQFFAYQNLLNKGEASLQAMYPRLKRWFDFMTGNDSASTTRMPSGLLRTWDYFYNSGGWDDYPPQHNLRFNPELYSSVTPVVSSAFYIRAGKIMRMMAERLGLKKDVKYFDTVISSISDAVQKYSWDGEAGYFSYVTHDSSGQADGIFRWKDGKTNFNMGLDGVSPLVAGICTQAQKDSLLLRIFSEDHLWCNAGISTVDCSAPYFTIDGYWNGCVWMPHQYVLWKTMLDLGRADLAEKIAYRALDVWENETESSYRSFEHFMIESARGKGWHNFSGLSVPVINWFASYFRSGSVTAGFDVMFSGTAGGMSAACDSFESEITFDKDSDGQTKIIILCMNPNYEYVVSQDGRPVEMESPRPGLLYVKAVAGLRKSRINVCVK